MPSGTRHRKITSGSCTGRSVDSPDWFSRTIGSARNSSRSIEQQLSALSVTGGTEAIASQNASLHQCMPAEGTPEKPTLGACGLAQSPHPSALKASTASSLHVDHDKIDKAIVRVRAQFATSRKLLKDFFRHWDKNGNGVIEVEEVQMALEDIGLSLNIPECQSLVDRFDNNGIPAIQHEDLVDLLCGGNELQSFAASRRATQFITQPVAALHEMRFDENLTGQVISWAGRQTRRPQNVHDLSSTPGTTVYGASNGFSESAAFHDYSQRATALDSGAVVVGEIGHHNSRDALEKLKRKTIKRFQTTGRNHLAVGTKPAWLQKSCASSAPFQEQPQKVGTAQLSQLQGTSGSTVQDCAKSTRACSPSQLSSYRSYGDGDFKDLLLRLRETQKRDKARIDRHFEPKGHLGAKFIDGEITVAAGIKNAQNTKNKNLGLHRSILYQGMPVVAAEVMRQEHESSHAMRISKDSGLDVEGLGKDDRWSTTMRLFSSGRALPVQEFDKVAGLQKLKLTRDATDQYEAVLAARAHQKKEWDAIESAQRLRMAAKAAAMAEDAAMKRRRDDLWEHQTQQEPNRIHTNPAQRSHADAFGFGFLPQSRPRGLKSGQPSK